ncbi:MAG: glucose-6-phosphate isomerase [Planctomycetota bacterium]
MIQELLRFHPDAAARLLPPGRIDLLKDSLLAAREETLNDVELWQSGTNVPADRQPLDAGFIQWPEEVLDDVLSNREHSLVSRIEACAARLKDQVDSVVVLGIGGSYMGMRAMFEALRHPYHNEQCRKTRGGIPRIYFEGWNVDSDQQRTLLDHLDQRAAADPDSVGGRTAVIVISKSGGTLETAVAFRTFRQFIERRFPALAKQLIVPVTGDSGRLRNLSNAAGYEDIFSIPDGIGGRFSVLTPVGLLPAAASGMNIRGLLQGAADMTQHFRSAPFESNVVLQYVAYAHAYELDLGMTIRILSTWGSKLEAVGLWYDQLLSESLGKHEKGAMPLTVVNTRDLHSRGQQHQEGRRDKLITNLLPGRPAQAPIEVPGHELDQDQLNQLAGVTMPQILQAAIDGTNQAYADERRPTMDLALPAITEHSIGQIFQMLMLATVVEGRLVGTNPYGQPGVEAYKKNMQANLGIRSA